MQIPKEGLDHEGARVAVADELAHAREPHSDERELSRGKKTVERDQRKDRE